MQLSSLISRPRQRSGENSLQEKCPRPRHPKASALKHTNVQAIPGVPSPTKASKPTEANSPLEAVTKPEPHSPKDGEKSLCCMSLVGLSVVFPGNASCSSISWVQLASQGRVHGLTLAQLPASCLVTSQWPCLSPLSAFDQALLSSLPRNAIDFTQHLRIKTGSNHDQEDKGQVGCHSLFSDFDLAAWRQRSHKHGFQCLHL